MKNLLEKIIEDKIYDDLGNWCLPNLGRFSSEKNLFEYQIKYLNNITKVLNEFYDNQASKKHLFDLYKQHGIENKHFAIEKFATKKDKENGIINKRFAMFRNYFEVSGLDEVEYISGSHFINRAALWMATGSGKSLVLIKNIELLDYLMNQKLIPQNEIMLLLPREDLVKQFKKEINEFNQGRERKIDLVNLKDYESDKQSFDFKNSIKVYYYRSDLLRDERKETILDYKSYLNDGKWYILLDEAHRGETGNSNMQDYVSILSRNGFLFNYSATFTDQIDYVTTCYNFNLEKFILAGYGKNIYLNQSIFEFNRNTDEISEQEKQKQVLKSLITFAYIKKSRKKGVYHNPLLITLVNSVNTEDSDLQMFFAKLEEIASGKIAKSLFNEAKKEILNDLRNNTSFVFGDEKLDADLNAIESLTTEDIFEQVFNAQNHGKIEILEGEKGKEIVLKLQTSTKPFALIKIGDTGKFKREQLGKNYSVLESFDTRRYFEGINQSEDINLLLGSRSFYEGWDSNRPNVINMINIGKQDAKKFVLQGIGRGIRIEPHKGERKRLSQGHRDKNSLLETLFVFATDKNAVKAIIETVEEQKNTDEVEISLFENQTKPFDLLIPVYKEENVRGKIVPFNISETSFESFKKYFNSFDMGTLLVKTGIDKSNLEFLREQVEGGDLFKIVAGNDYHDMEMLLHKLIGHISIKNKVVNSVKVVEDEIIHFKHIKVNNFSSAEVESFKDKIEKVKNFKGVDKKEIEAKIKSGEISFDEALALGNAKNEESFKDLKIKHIAEHYYLPLIYSEIERVEYIKHVINIQSEVEFIKNLEDYISGKVFDFQWMFSKVDESIDKKLGMPYFTNENFYKDFYHDFIFWIKKGDNYKIVFIDPKGGVSAVSQKKMDGFKKLFEENGKLKEFSYKNFNITFELYFVGENEGGEAYEKYWIKQGEFSFLN